MTTIPAAQLATVFVEAADTLVDEFDLVDFLRTLTHRVAGLVDASEVGLLLADQRGHLEFVAASDERLELLELFQLQNSEGPCLDAFHTGKPVINADLRHAGERWPRFSVHATGAGFRSVHAFPLRLRNQVIGALNLFGNDPGNNLDEDDLQIMQAIADVAAISLLQERAVRRGEILTEQLQNALNTRIVIEQAKGAIAQLRNINVDEAFELIRSYARNHRQRLSDVAYAIVTDLASVPEISGH